MKTKNAARLSYVLAAIATAATLTGCQGLTFAVSTPYGDATSNPDGSANVVLRPIVIPSNSSK